MARWSFCFFASVLPLSMSNQDPIFNFTSYLCSPDGCKLILWKRAAAAPSRGPFLASGAATGSTGEGHPPKWGWMSRNKSCFKVESDTQISTEQERSLADKKRKKKNTLKTTKSILMPTGASVFSCLPLINNRESVGLTALEKPGETFLKKSLLPAFSPTCENRKCFSVN